MVSQFADDVTLYSNNRKSLEKAIAHKKKSHEYWFVPCSGKNYTHSFQQQKYPSGWNRNQNWQYGNSIVIKQVIKNSNWGISIYIRKDDRLDAPAILWHATRQLSEQRPFYILEYITHHTINIWGDNGMEFWIGKWKQWHNIFYFYFYVKN